MLKCCPGVCLRFGSSPFGNGSHHLRVMPPSEGGMGMSMPLAVPVSSGNYSGTCVSTALLWNLTRCPSQPLRQGAPLMLLQLSCARALRRQTALSMRLHVQHGCLRRLSYDGGSFTLDGAFHGMT